jgi:hypothetical protein
MSQMLPVYRMTVFAPLTTDSTESTPLSPVAGAPHADQFKVATSEGIAGFKPYLGMPTGRRGRIDLMSKKTDTGEISFDLLDARVAPGGTNAVRWVTAFVGSAHELPQFTRLRVLVEESLDGGVTWINFFVGRLVRIGVKPGSRAMMSITVRDLSADMAFDAFVGMPHEIVRQSAKKAVTSATSTTLTDSTLSMATNAKAGAVLIAVAPGGAVQTRQVISNTATVFTVAAWGTIPDATYTYYTGYAQLVSVMPVGFIRPYGIAPTTPELRGVVSSVDATNGWALITVNPIDLSAIGNLFTGTLHLATTPSISPWNIPQASATDATKIVPTFTGLAVAHVTRTDTGAEGDFYVGYGYLAEQPLLGGIGGSLSSPFTTAVWALSIRAMTYPIGVATGTPQANGAQAATPTATSTSVTTKGWTISTTNILAAGDIISFSGHQQRYFVKAAVNSDGSGNATVVLAGGLQVAIANNEAITVQRSAQQMPVPAATTPLKFHVICDIPLADGGGTTPVYNTNGAQVGTTVKPGNLLLVNDVHPAQMLKDVLLGYYGRYFKPTFDQNSQPTMFLPAGKNLGDPYYAFQVQNADTVGDGRHGFDALIANSSFPTFRCIVDKNMPIRDFVEKYICQPYGIGYYFDGSGNFVPVDCRQPTSIPGGTPTITDADLVDDKPANWTYDPTQATTSGAYQVYAEAIFQPIQAQIVPGHPFPEISTAMFTQAAGQVLDFGLGNAALGQKPYNVDYKGFRAMPGENALWIGYAGFPFIVSRYWLIAQQALGQAIATVARPFGNGAQIVVLNCVRNANTASIFPGSFVVVNVAANVDTVTNTRGPSRLVFVTERAENGAQVKFTGIDWGVNVVSTPPTSLGTPALLAGDGAHSCTCLVTANAAGDPTEAHVNVTTTATGSRPADSDPGWVFVNRAPGTWTYTVRGLPAGARVWWRARTAPYRLGNSFGNQVLVNALKLPSAWVYPSTTGGTDSVDLTSLSAPTSLTSPFVGANAIDVTWANPDATKMLEVWLSFPATTGVPTFLARLPPGSTTYLVTGLSPSTTYRVRVRTVDTVGGFAEATVDVATSASIIVVQPPIAIRGGHLMF